MAKSNIIRQYIRKLVQEALKEATDPAVKKAEIDAAAAEVKAAEAKRKAAQDKLKAAQALKEDDMLLSSLIEAEKEEEAPKEEEGEENPFAAAAEEEPSGEEEGGEEKGEEKPSKEAKPEKQENNLKINFNLSAVKKYNDALFTNNQGTVKKITKDGLTVQVEPDGVDVFVNFDDITEQTKKFFKKGK